MLGLYTLGNRPSLPLQKNDLFESNTCQGTLKFTTLNFYDILNLIKSIFAFYGCNLRTIPLVIIKTRPEKFINVKISRT